MTKINWVPDLAAEQMMKEFGVEFTTQWVSLASIDLEGSLLNHARLRTHLDDSVVTEYQTNMEREHPFPMTVLFLLKPGKYSVAGGNHRLTSAKNAGADKVLAYVVKTSDESVIDLLPRILNRGHGKGLVREDAIKQAMYAVETYGMEYKQAEDAFGLPKNCLSQEARVRDVQQLLKDHHVPVAKINKTVLRTISTVSGNANVAVTAGRIAANKGMGVEDVKQMIKEVKKCKTEASQIGKLSEFEELLGVKNKPEATSKYSRSDKTKILLWLRNGENYLDGVDSLAQLQITTPEDQAAILPRFESLEDRLHQIICGNGKKGHSKSPAKSAARRK